MTRTYDTTLEFLVDESSRKRVNVRFVVDTNEQSWKVIDFDKDKPLDLWWFDYNDFCGYLEKAINLTDADYGICILNKNYEQARDPVNKGYYRIGECRL